jgi:hypothetical protein
MTGHELRDAQVFVATVDAPRFYKGYRAGLAASLALSAWLPVVVWFTRRQRKQQEAAILYGRRNSSVGAGGDSNPITISEQANIKDDKADKA